MGVIVGGHTKAAPVAWTRAEYRHDLDGLRAFAVLLVVLDHAEWPFPNGMGSAGVGAFFVLSGYVITNVLLDRGPLRFFYARRALRLFPAIALLIAFVAVVGLSGRWPQPWAAGIVSTVLYVTNWANIAGVNTGPMAHTWSLAIEEQFYLVWPVLLLALGRRAWMLAVTGIGLAFLARANLDGLTAYYSTFARMDALLVGALLAIVPGRLPRMFAPVGLAVLVIAGLSIGIVADTIVMPLVTVGAALVIRAPWPPLARLAPMGRRAYGIYLWNWPLAMLVGPLAAPLTFVAAELSYRYLEQPFLRLKDRVSLAPVPSLSWAAS